MNKPDILDRLNEALGIKDPDSKLRNTKAKALSLVSSGFGHYKGPDGQNWKWNEKTKNFEKTASTGEGSGTLEAVVEHFIKKFGMVRVGKMKLKDPRGQIWQIGANSLVKISKSKN